MRKKSKKNSLKKRLHNKCWELMKMYVRLKDSDEKGITQCITCGKKEFWKKMQSGHFHHGSLDYDLRNVNCQCVRCNNYLSGNLAEYSVWMLKKYGATEMIKLWQEHHRKGNDYSIEELEKIAIDLTLKLSELGREHLWKS